MTRIRLGELKEALEIVLKERDIEPERADEIAERVMNLFGYDSVITDNLLSNNERDYFYMLEDFDMVTGEEETAYLPSGKRWRIHYWRLKKNKIKEIIEESKKEEEEVKEESIYDQLSNDIWARANKSRAHTQRE
ncbi:MAG: DUF6015 family protein [Thermoplasmatota archaeon]